jgi:hypothetical protein
MRTITALCSSFIALFLLGSCGPKQQDKSEQTNITCSYSYDVSSSVLEWTAFKFTDKTPVKGGFNEINIKSEKSSSEKPEEIIKSLSVVIQTSSVETQNEERNGKIMRLFFGAMKNQEISGKFSKLGEDGKAILVLTMNAIEKEVNGTYQLIDGTFTFNGTIDVANWNSLDGINALNKACKDLHTGKDGKSKLWSEVALNFSTTLKSTCK